MPASRSETATEDAVRALSSLGLTSYEAKCYVALLRLGGGTAREISDVSTVPRSRVYDAAKSLHEQGFVDIEYSNPRTYRPVSVDRALELISARRAKHERTLEEAVARLPGIDDDEDDEGVWTVSGCDNVRDRESRLVGNATDRVVAYACDGALGRPFLRELDNASERGADVTLLVDGEVARRDATAELGDGVTVLTPQRSVRPLRPDGGGDREYVARALCLDDEAAMVVSARENDGVGTSRESAVWSRDAGPGVGFVHLVSGVLADAAG
jgi:sugar-specific transcriptional regulator TrmB